ncbi:MAG: preprotein translocase subunit SecA [Anaerolineae bacterium]|nr:preprotein translocase subunit SecA [Anaerolineae bacterium]
MLKGILKKVIPDRNERQLGRLGPLVEEVAALEAEYERLPDGRMRDLTQEWRREIQSTAPELRERATELEAQLRSGGGDRQRLAYDLAQLRKRILAAEGEAMDSILPQAFALVREAGKRTLGQRIFDVQVMGGVVLHRGQIAEMKTGEGKTITATMPLYLNALAGRGAHLVTPNDYLAKVGAQWMGPIYHLLGLKVGVIQNAAADRRLGSFIFDPSYQAEDDRYQHLRPVERAEAYAADVTYGTNNEFGFDYLRDNMVVDLRQRVQRELYYAIVDEVDNILIDEARTPLIISGEAEESAQYYQVFARLVPRLRPEHDYVVDEKDRIVTLTDEGVAKIESALNIDNLYSPEHYHLTPYLDNALRAHVLYQRDRDYIVQQGEVIIVDEFTGRLMHGRRFSEGLHQAIEAKEGVKVQKETMTWATITFQNYFRMYDKLAGMTGTAATEAEEFSRIYGLDVVVVPTNKPMIREDAPDLVYKSEAAKYRAVVAEIEEMHRIGRPVLVGTASIERSEMLSAMLKRKGIPHQVLNAKQHEREAAIIAQAGRPGAVTIATNMAGRGVDILLGGNPEGIAREELRRQGVDLTTVSPQEWEAAVARAREMTERDRQRVLELGGLHIIGTERHEARRIDNQLRGRGGRQGDPGSSRFYLSLEDDLMRRFGGDSVRGLMDRLGVEEDMPIVHGLVSKAIESAQTRVEGHNFDIRKHVLQFDDVVNTQREVIYEQRRRVLSEANLRDVVWDMVEAEIAGAVHRHLNGSAWDLDGFLAEVGSLLPLPATTKAAELEGLDASQIEDRFIELARQAYEARERQYGEQVMRQLERMVILRAVDTRWVRHLTDLDALREGIGLRAFGQQDPLVAYKREAHAMFDELNAAIQRDVVSAIFRAQLVAAPQPAVDPQRLRTNRADGGGVARTPVRATAQSKLGRNDPCWCGSGKKYKHCHMRQDQGLEPEASGAQGGHRDSDNRQAGLG